MAGAIECPSGCLDRTDSSFLVAVKPTPRPTPSAGPIAHVTNGDSPQHDAADKLGRLVADSTAAPLRDPAAEVTLSA